MARQRYGEMVLPVPVKGMNTSLPPSQIDDAECADCLNFWLTPDGQIESRPGLTKLTTTAGTGSSIKGIYYSPVNNETLVASGTKLYKYASNSVTEIGTLSGTGDRVHMLDFNGKTYVASGGILQVYDGSTLSNCTNTGTNDVPPDATYLLVRRDRLFVACETDSSLYYSGSYDAGDWGGGESADGGIIHVRKNDGAKISGLAQVDSNVVIFKSRMEITGSPQPCSLSLLTGTVPIEFAIKDVREGTSCIAPHTIAPALNDVFFCGNGGVYALSQVRNYTDPRSFPLSLKIHNNYIFTTPYCASYSPRRGMYFLVTNGNTFVFHTGMKAWFMWKFAGITPTYVANSSDNSVLFGADNGHLYKLDDTGLQYQDDGTNPSWQFSTKAFNLDSPTTEKWFHRLYMTLRPLSGSGVIGVNYKKNTGYSVLGSRSVAATTSDIAAWDGEFAWDVEGVGWDEEAFMQLGHMIRLRGRNIQFQIVPTIPIHLVEWSVHYEYFRRSSLSWK